MDTLFHPLALVYLYLGLVGKLVPYHNAHFANYCYSVSGSNFGVDCGTPANPGTFGPLLSSGRSRESNLDHTDLVGIRLFSTRRCIGPPLGADRPLAVDLHRALFVLLVLLAD